jgi:hypothetical protein
MRFVAWWAAETLSFLPPVDLLLLFMFVGRLVSLGVGEYLECQSREMERRAASNEPVLHKSINVGDHANIWRTKYRDHESGIINNSLRLGLPCRRGDTQLGDLVR